MRISMERSIADCQALVVSRRRQAFVLISAFSLVALPFGLTTNA